MEASELVVLCVSLYSVKVLTCDDTAAKENKLTRHT